MSFEKQVLIWCLGVPLLVTGVCLLVAWLISRRSSDEGRQTSRSTAAGALVIAIGWASSVYAATWGRGGWDGWPTEAWHQALIPIFAWAVWASVRVVRPNQSDTWVSAGVLSLAVAVIAIPSGENWEDMFGLHRIWIAAIAGSCLLNSYSLDKMSRLGADRWVTLVALAGLAGPMSLAASAYASLAECALAALVATTLCAVVGIACRNVPVSAACFPATATAGVIGLTGRFYTYEEYPAWAYGLMLGLPTMVATVDLVLCRRTAVTRVTVAATLSAAIVAATVWSFLLRE